jgi:hypothetical protein
VARGRERFTFHREAGTAPMQRTSFAEVAIFLGLAVVIVGALVMEPAILRHGIDFLTASFSHRAQQGRAEAQARMDAYEKARGEIRESMEPKWTNHFSNLDLEEGTSCRRRSDGLWEATGFVEWDSQKGRRRDNWVVVLDAAGKSRVFLRLGGHDVGQYPPEPGTPRP